MIPSEAVAYYVPANDGNPSRLIVFLTDITARKQTETTLLRMKDAAEAANRAKSAFLANMSHEIRTPLNAILGLAHILHQSELTAEQAETLERIAGAGKHLLSIINDILDLSKIDSGRMELERIDFLLPSLIDQVKSLIIGQTKAKGLLLNMECDHVPLWVKGDPTRLRQALPTMPEMP